MNYKHVVDIGANCGQFSLVSCKYFPDARIDSFEPLEKPADRYEKVFVGDAHVYLHRCAIGAEKATMTIHVSEGMIRHRYYRLAKNSRSFFHTPVNVKLGKRRYCL